jgi:hypothetical protein
MTSTPPLPVCCRKVRRREDGKSYALHTARQAAAAVERRQQQEAFRPAELARR